MQWFGHVLWILVAFVIAVAITAVLGSASSTHFVLAEYAALGHPPTLQERLDMTIHDIVGMGFGRDSTVPGLYPVLIAIGLTIAFLAAGLVARIAPALRWLVFMVAGGAALLVMMVSLEAALGLMPISGVRTTAGLAGQGVAGAIGGLVFALLKQKR